MEFIYHLAHVIAASRLLSEHLFDLVPQLVDEFVHPAFVAENVVWSNAGLTRVSEAAKSDFSYRTVHIWQYDQ